MAEPTENACRGCGTPLPWGVQLCESCIAKLAHEIELAQDRTANGDRNHTWDIVIATIVFGFTNVCLIALAGDDFFSTEAMISRIILLGIPLAAVMWKWYGLMHEADPDYGRLWSDYWTAQLMMFLILLVLPLFIVLIYLTAVLMLRIL